MENKKLQTGGETTNTDSSNDFFNYVDNIFKTQILPKKDIEPALPKIEDLDIDLDLIKKVDEPDLGWKSAKEKFLTDTFEVGTSDEELNRIKNFDFSLRDGDNRYQRRYDNMNWGSNLLRTVGNYAATGMEIATGMAGGLWEGGEELVDEVSEQTGLDIYNNKEFGKNWLLSASDWLRESKPEIYDNDGVEQGEGNFWEQLKDIKNLDLGDIYKAGSVIPSVFGSMAVAIPLTAVIMPSSIAAGAAVGGVPGAVVGGFMGKTVVAAALAYAEGMMDAKDVYKEKYDEIFEKTMDVNYAENVAKTAANKNLLYNTALNTPLNLIEVGFLTKYLKKPAFKSFDTFNPDKLHGRYKPTLLAGETTEDYIARMARNEIRDSSGNVIGYKSNLNRSFTEFLKDIPDDIGYNIRNKKEFIGRHYDDILSPLSEGLEEYNNFWSREKGMENVDTKLSIAGMLSDGTSYLPEFAQNMKEGEGVFDILSGMLGAVVTNPIMTNVHIKRDKIYDPISNTYKFKYDRSDLNPFKETDFFQFGKKEADKKDMKSYIERSIDNIRTTKKLFSDFNNSPDIETKSHLLDQMMIQPITEAISSNTLNTKIATYQEGLNMLQEKRNEPLENKLDFLSTTDKTNVQNLMLKLSTASEQVEIDTINGQLDNYNKTANKHIELQSKTIKENIDYLNQLNTAYVSLYSQKQTENDYGYLNELFKAQFSYDQELKFRTKLERDLESRITELTSLAPNKNEALMSLENDTEFNQAQDNLLASEIRAMQFGARLNMLRRGEFLEDTHNILEQDLIDKIETYKIDSPEILAYKKYVRLKSLPERFQESIKGELKRMEENELKSFFEFKNNYNQLIELQNKKAKEDNESAIYKYIKRSQKVADLHHKLAKNKVEFDNFYKLIDSTSAYFKYFTEFGDFGYDELISNLTSQLAMKDWYSNYLTFYNAVIQDIELFEVNNPTLSSDYKGRIIHLKKQIKTNHLRITQFYIIQSTKFKKRNTIDDILGYLNSNQKPVSGKLPWNYEDLLNNIKSEFGITVDEDGTYQTNRVNYVIQYEDKFHIAKNESKKIEYDFNTNSFISVEYINEFKRNDPKLIVISKRTTPLNYNDDYIDLSSGTLLKDFLKENGLTLTLVNEYNIDVVNGVNLNIFTEDKDNKKRQLIFIKEALASKDKSPDISKLSNDSKDIYNKIKKALEDTTNSLVLSDSGNTPIDRNNLDNIIEIMQNDLTLEIINERFTEEEIKDMMEGKDEAIENIIKVLTDGELPDTKNLREIYNKYFKEIDGIKSAFIDDDEYDIKESYNKWGGILITHIFKSIESMDLKSKIDIAHRLRKSIGSENADSVKDLHYQLFFYYIGDEKILSEIKDELIHNINDMKKSVFEIEPELIDGDYDKIINGNEKEVEGLIESYQGFYKAIKFINKLRQIEGELFSDFDRIIDEENQIFNDKDKTLLKARFNKDKLNEYYDNWINSLGVRVTPKDVVEDVKDLTVTNTPIPPTTNTPIPPTTSNQSEIEAKKADLSLDLLTTTEIILNGTNKKLYYSSNDIITGEETLKEIKGNFNIKRDEGSRFDLYKGDTKIANFKIVTDENDFIIDDISTVRNIRRQGVMTFLIRALSRSNEMKHGKTLKIRTSILKQDGKSLLDSLEKKGIGFYTTDDLFQISPTNLFAQITPQQKQQPKETIPSVEDWSRDVESTAKALEGVDKKNLPKVKVSNEDVIALRNAKTKEQIDAALLQASQEQSISMALDNLGFLVSGIKEKYYNKDYSWLEDLANEIEKISKGTTTDVKSISEAYHKAKADGSNPELVKAVEDLLGKPTEQPKETIPNVEAKKADKAGVEELFEFNPELAEAVYEALEFNQSITPADKIIWGHPTIGKTTAKNQKDFLDFDTDFKPLVAEKLGLPKSQQNSIGLNEWRKTGDEKAFNKAMREVWALAKEQAKTQGKALMVSDMLFLKENQSDFDKIINIPSDVFISRASQRGDDSNSVQNWKNNIDQTLKNVASSKVITTDKYLSDLFLTPQQKQEAQQRYSSYLQTTNNPTIEGFKQWNNRQQQINELFEQNSELANKVYEALGFKSEKTIETAKGSTYRYLPSGKTQRFKKVEGKEYEPQDILTFVPNYEWIKSNNPQWLEKQGLENDTQYTQYLLEKVQGKDKVWIVDSKGKKIETNQEAKTADRLFIAFGKKDGSVEDFIPVSKEPVIGFYTYDSRIHFDEKGERYRDRHLGNKVVKITEGITPQQKQEAQQRYSSYLQTTNNPTIEGFKNWVSSTPQSTNVDENPNQTHIDKINAKHDAELAASEQSKGQKAEMPTTEAKKDDIERRRQENPSVERGVLINYESGKTKEQLIDIVSKLKEGKITYDEIVKEFFNLPANTFSEVKEAFKDGTLADKIQFGLDVKELSDAQPKTRSKEEIIKLRHKTLSEKQKAETALKDSEYKIVKKKEPITGVVTETKVKRTVEEKAIYEDFYRKKIEEANKEIEEYDAELKALGQQQENLQKEENKRQEIKRQEEELNRLIAIEEAQKEQEKAAEAEAEKQQKLRDLHNDVSFSLGFFETADKQKNLIKLMRANQTKIDPNSNFKFEINSVIYDSIEELFKHDSSYINLNSTIKVLDEKDNVIKEIPLTVNNKLIKDILLDDDILIRDMMSKRREEVLKLLTNTSSTDPIKYNFNKLVKLIEFEYLFGIFEIDDIEHYDTYNKVVLFLNKLKGSGDIIVDTSTNVPSFKFNVGTKNEKNYIGLTIPEDVEIFQLVQLKDTELKKAFYENYKYEDKYYYDEKTNKLTFKNKNDFNKVRAGYYTEDDGTNSEFPYAKTRKIFPSVIDWALYKKNPLLYLKHKKRGINLDGETNLINSTSLKFNTDAYKNKLIKSFQLLKSTPKIFEFTYKDSTETEIRIRIEKSENGEFTVITDLDEKSGLSRHESLKVDGTYTFYLDDNKENMLFQIIENKVETSSFKYENAKKVLDDIIKEMTDENNIAEWEDEKFSRFYSDIDVTMYNKFLYVIRELRANLFLLGNPIIKDIIYYFTDFGDSIYLDSNRNAVKFEFRNELPYDIPINNLIDFTRSLFEDFNLDDFNVVVKGLSEVKLESLVDIKTLTFYKNQVKHITESESNYLLWLKQYFYYLHKYNPNKQREIQVGNKLYKLNDSVRLKDSKNLVHITDISNENGIPKFNNIVFDSDLHEAEVFSENDNELINGDKIYIFKNNEWRIKSEGDIEEIDEDLRNLLEDFRNKEIININNKDKNADLLVNNSIRFVNIINNRLRNDNEKLLINENLIENKINKDTLLKIIQNNKQDILNFVFRKSDSKFDDSDVHIQVPDEDLSNKIKKDALSEENYDALAYVLTNEGKLIPQNGGIVENDFRSFEVDANKINTDIKAFFNGEILNFKENGKAIIEVRSVKVTTKFEEISIGDNNSLELLVTSNAVELFILINHYLDPKGELDLLNNLNEKDVNELKTKANIYARIRILLDGVGIDQPIEKYIKDNFEDIHTLYKNVIQVVQIETDEVETDKSVHLGYLHDLTHYFKSNDIEKAYSMIVNYYNKVLSKFIKNDFQLKFKVRIENEGYLIASDKEDSFLVNYPKITKVYRFKGHGKDVKLHEFDVKNGKFKQVLLDVFEEKELKAIITEFLLIKDSNTDKVPDKEDLILMIETYLKNKDTINTAFFTILDNQFSFNKRILKLNNNKWDSIKENDKNLYQHYFDLFLGTLQKGTTNESIKLIIDNLFILYKDYGKSASEYANDKSKEVIDLLQSKIDNESYYKKIVLPIYVVKNGSDFVFKLIGKIEDKIHVLELTRTGDHITYKILEYDIGTEKLAEKIQDRLAKMTQIDNDGYTEWLEIMFPYIPIDIDMASFDNADFGGSEIERFKLSYFTNTKSIEGNNFTNPLVKLDLREVEPYKTKSDKVDSAKIIDENITTKNLNLRTSLTELSSNTKGFSKGDVDSVILKILNVTSTQNEEAFNLILNEFKPLQVILQDFEDKIKITSISQTTFINNFKEFFKKNRGNINQFLIEKSNGDDSNNIESCI